MDDIRVAVCPARHEHWQDNQRLARPDAERRRPVCELLVAASAAQRIAVEVPPRLVAKRNYSTEIFCICAHLMCPGWALSRGSWAPRYLGRKRLRTKPGA
jgi:hypothetical protein